MQGGELFIATDAYSSAKHRLIRRCPLRTFGSCWRRIILPFSRCHASKTAGSSWSLRWMRFKDLLCRMPSICPPTFSVKSSNSFPPQTFATFQYGSFSRRPIAESPIFLLPLTCVSLYYVSLFLSHLTDLTDSSQRVVVHGEQLFPPFNLLQLDIFARRMEELDLFNVGSYNDVIQSGRPL